MLLEANCQLCVIVFWFSLFCFVFFLDKFYCHLYIKCFHKDDYKNPSDLFLDLFQVFKINGYTSMFSAIFTNGNNFSDFL